MRENKMYITWLRDAYAMEQGIVEVLERQIEAAEDHPQIHDKLQEHLEQTKMHAEKVRSCLERLGEDISEFKAGVANITGAIQGMMGKMTRDSLIKMGIANYATEHFEIASYMSLIAAARAQNDTETARVCEEIVAEEKDMALWIADNIEELTRLSLPVAVAA